MKKKGCARQSTQQGVATRRPRKVVALAFCALTTPIAAAPAGEFTGPRAVEIVGYHDHAMEPFVSRDGRYLLFNNRNDPNENTDLHWAERMSDLSFRYRGRIKGVNTSALEGVPSLDRQGNLYFISPRSYKDTLSTVYRARFKDGKASALELVKGLSLGRSGIVTFDAEISLDGQFLYGADGDFSGGGGLPKTADIFVARRIGDQFERTPDSARIMASINTSAMEYAPSVSADGLELVFTRLSGALFWRKPTIEHAIRKSVDAPFTLSRTIAAITGFVEAPSNSGDGRALYYHSKVDGMHRIYRATRP